MPKKILMLAFDFPPNWGGVATYGWELAKAFHQAGCEVEVISRQPDDPDLEANFKITRFKMPARGILSWPLYTAHLARHLYKNEYDHIFCNLWMPDAISLWSAQQILRTRTPFSVSVHAMEIIESRETMAKRFRNNLEPIKRKVFQEAEHVFCVSQFSRNLLSSMINLEKDKVHVVNNGANPDSFTCFPKASKKDLRLFTACRLQANKGIDQVIKSLPTLVKTYPDLKYHVAGEGPDLPRLMKLTDMMGMKQVVQFLGKIDHERLNREYSEADLFVMVSRRERHRVEGFGLVYLEAALCGTPSLGGRSGGIPDAIIEDQTGWLVDPYDEHKVEDKLLQILSDREELKKVGNQARERTLKERTWQKQAQRILEKIDG